MKKLLLAAAILFGIGAFAGTAEARYGYGYGYGYGYPAYRTTFYRSYRPVYRYQFIQPYYAPRPYYGPSYFVPYRAWGGAPGAFWGPRGYYRY